RDRRLDPVRAALDAAHALACPGRAALRRGLELGRGDRLCGRRRDRACRGLRRVPALRERTVARAPPVEGARAEVLLGRGVRPCLLPPRRPRRARTRPLRRAARRRRLDRGGERRRPPRRGRGQPRPERARPRLHARTRDRRRRPRRLPPHEAMTSWLTRILIVLPGAGALVVWLVPMPRQWVGSLAALVSLVEVAVWIAALQRFDFARSDLQLAQRHSWFGDLGVSYYVGQFGYSLWLIGLTAICGAAACLYAWWVGRDRPRAYFGLLLLLMGAVVGVFAAQDLLLFYAFFEAMLIPLYVLIGVWGGAGRMRATITFVVYTVAGSLMMLAAIVVYGLQQGTFDLTRMGTSSNDWLFLGFAIAFAIKAPLWPFHGWLPDAYRESPAEVAALLSGVISKVAAYGLLRIAIKQFPGPTHDFRVPILVLASIGLVYGSLLAFRAPDVRGVIAYSSLAQMGLITYGLFAANSLGSSGAVLQMVNHGL